jgi:hypothetical protein
MQRDVQLGSNPLQAAVDGATFIANHFRQKTEDDEVNLKHTHKCIQLLNKYGAG